MARTSTSAKGSGTSRIRFIMLDAELNDGDLAQVTQVLQSAFKPTVIQQRRLPVSVDHALSEGATEAEPTDETEEAAAEISQSAHEKRRAGRDGKARPPRSPQVVNDLDLHVGVSLADFIGSRKIEADTDRYLTVAAWFKECRELGAVTMDQVYTCFRSLGWSTAHADFGGPLRYLKSQQLMSTPKRGHYAINHIGLDRVKKIREG